MFLREKNSKEAFDDLLAVINIERFSKQIRWRKV